MRSEAKAQTIKISLILQLTYQMLARQTRLKRKICCDSSESLCSVNMKPQGLLLNHRASTGFKEKERALSLLVMCVVRLSAGDALTNTVQYVTTIEINVPHINSLLHT